MGTRLRALREQRQLTQAEFGRLLGVDQSTISRIEDGTRPITARELATASSELGVTIGDLLEDAQQAPALLRAGEAEDEGVRESLRVFNACIDEYRGIEALAQ